MKRLIACLPVVMLAACVQTDAPALTEPNADGCGASAHQRLVGQPEAVLAKMSFPEGTRILRPNQAVTADYSVGRLNIEIGTSGRIDKVSCY